VPGTRRGSRWHVRPGAGSPRPHGRHQGLVTHPSAAARPRFRSLVLWLRSTNPVVPAALATRTAARAASAAAAETPGALPVVWTQACPGLRELSRSDDGPGRSATRGCSGDLASVAANRRAPRTLRDAQRRRRRTDVVLRGARSLEVRSSGDRPATGLLLPYCSAPCRGKVRAHMGGVEPMGVAERWTEVKCTWRCPTATSRDPTEGSGDPDPTRLMLRHRYRWIRDDPPAARARTSARPAMVVSPG
jgi:hypothetical protein